MTKPQDIQVGEIRELNLRQVFPREDTSFTPWLSMPQNLARLSSAVGFELEVLDTEVRSKTFRLDILARRTMDDSLVIIENQFERSDHSHLGQTLTYLAAHEAKTVIWIAERFADEHRQAMEWLNDNTSDEFSFFAVVPRLIQIGDSQPGLRFELEVKPNQFVKKMKTTKNQHYAPILELRDKVWQRVQAQIEDTFGECSTRYGGRQGHLWIIPPNTPLMNGREAHILLYLNIPKNGAHRINYYLSCGQDLGPDEAQDCLAFAQKVWHDAIVVMDAQRIDAGSTLSNRDRNSACSAYFDVNLADDESLTKGINSVLSASRVLYETLRDAL